MMSRTLKSVLFAVLVLTAFSRTSAAVPVYIQPNNANNAYNLAAGDVYIALRAPSPGNFSHNYFFDITNPPLQSTTVALTFEGPGFGFESLTMQWYEQSTPSGPYNTPIGPALSGPGMLSLALTEATYRLRVFGEALAGGGAYQFTLSAVPLPPALILFGTALAGLTLLGRRRRKQTAESLA